MSHASDAEKQPHVVRATLNYYLDPAKGGYQDFWFGTVGEKRRPFEHVEVPITDMRGREEEFHLDVQGFQKVEHTSEEKEFTDLDTIRQVYYPECAELVKKTTGATRIHIMGHVCRRQSWDEFREKTQTMHDMDRTPIPTTARYIHVDYSYSGAQTRLDFYLPSAEASQLRKSRWAIINIWRPILRPVTRENLSLCDARSVDDSELRPVIARFRRPGDAENLNPITRAAYDRNDVETWSVAPDQARKHRWYFCSGLRPEEALLIKIFDSLETKGVARRTLHTAFVCAEDCGPARESVEVRALVFWEDQGKE